MPILTSPPAVVPLLAVRQPENSIPAQLSYSGAVAFRPSSADDLTGPLSQSSTLTDIYVHAGDLQNSADAADAVASTIDRGAATVFLTTHDRAQLEQLVDLLADGAVGRIGAVAGSIDTIESAIETIETALGLSADQISAFSQTKSAPAVWVSGIDSAVQALAWAQSPEGSNIVKARSVLVEVAPALLTSPDAVELAKAGVSVVVREEEIGVQSDKVDYAAVLLARAVSDRPDGLFATVVMDELGTALGLVYSSDESVRKSIETGQAVYQSRKRGLWYKGASSGDTQTVVRLVWDCDSDCLGVVVRQHGRGFCHLAQASCFGPSRGLARLQSTLQSRKLSAPAGSYTARIFSDPDMLRAKILEEAAELADATEQADVAFEAADLFYFAMARCVAAGVSLDDVERELDRKSAKVSRRKGDAKQEWVKAVRDRDAAQAKKNADAPATKPAAVVSKPSQPSSDRIKMKRIPVASVTTETLEEALRRPAQRSFDAITGIVQPIIDAVRTRGDAAVLEYTKMFDKAESLASPVLRAPFPAHLMELPAETIDAIDVSFENIRKFHAAQADNPAMLTVETMPGVRCHRFSRPIESVGLYVPGGSAVLPSTTLMLGVPAMVAGCKTIVVASPPRPDGSISPEIVYVAHKVGAAEIVLAGGAQAVAALAYGTESITKVDKILGPGNQFVTAAKMIVANDTSAGVAIDMPAGPSEVLVIADETTIPAFAASDLLSQAEHGADSQVILVAAGLSEAKLAEIDDEVDKQARVLPRVDIVRKSIAHSSIFVVDSVKEAIALSNKYAPEHLILHLDDAPTWLDSVQNAGSVFIGHWTPESVGDYSAGVNHSLPTYGYAKQYSGVSLASFVKHITASHLTPDGLVNIGKSVMRLAAVEELEAHRRAVEIRLDRM